MGYGLPLKQERRNTLSSPRVLIKPLDPVASLLHLPPHQPLCPESPVSTHTLLLSLRLGHGLQVYSCYLGSGLGHTAGQSMSGTGRQGLSCIHGLHTLLHTQLHGQAGTHPRLSPPHSPCICWASRMGPRKPKSPWRIGKGEDDPGLNLILETRGPQEKQEGTHVPVDTRKVQLRAEKVYSWAAFPRNRVWSWFPHTGHPGMDR